jgi:hypothetical protein
VLLQKITDKKEEKDRSSMNREKNTGSFLTGPSVDNGIGADLQF